MYYPSRIQQLMDAGDISALREVTAYYRDLYDILIRQAIEQVNRIKLHVRPVAIYGQQVLGDENLLRYLFELLKGTVEAEVTDDKYVAFHVTLHSSQLSTFTSLLARQIVRDHGEATNCRGCGIVVEQEHVIITLPRYNGKL
jgi:hypothetical protein